MGFLADLGRSQAVTNTTQALQNLQKNQQAIRMGEQQESLNEMELQKQKVAMQKMAEQDADLNRTIDITTSPAFLSAPPELQKSYLDFAVKGGFVDQSGRGRKRNVLSMQQQMVADEKTFESFAKPRAEAAKAGVIEAYTAYQTLKDKPDADPEKLEKLFATYKKADANLLSLTGNMDKVTEGFRAKDDLKKSLETLKASPEWQTIPPMVQGALATAASQGDKDLFQKAYLEAIKNAGKPKKTIERTVDRGDVIEYFYTDGTMETKPKGITPGAAVNIQMQQDRPSEAHRQYLEYVKALKIQSKESLTEDQWYLKFYKPEQREFVGQVGGEAASMGKRSGEIVTKPIPGDGKLAPRVPQALPEKIETAINGAYDALDLLDIIEKNANEAMGIPGLGEAKGWIKSKLGAKGAQEFNAANAQLTVKAQDIIKGIPSNWDVQNFKKTLATMGDTPQEVLQKTKMSKQLILNSLETGMQSYGQGTHIMPDIFYKRGEKRGLKFDKPRIEINPISPKTADDFRKKYGIGGGQ